MLLARNFFAAIVEVMSEDQLLHLLRKKKGFFEAILDLSEDESELQIHDWISSLEQKKILLSCVDEVDAEISLFKRTLHNLSQETSEELENIRKVITRILHLDTINQEKRKKELRPDGGSNS